MEGEAVVENDNVIQGDAVVEGDIVVMVMPSGDDTIEG